MDMMFEKVREIVDARIAARAAREERLLRIARAASAEDGKGAGRAQLCTGPVDRRIELSRACDSPNRYSIVFGQIPRLPENLPVPSVEPRPPNLKAANLSFAARVVIAVRDRFGGDAPKVYTAAKVTRQAYSQIVSDETHSVSKRTAVRFAFALHCDKDEARLLLKAAGYAFSNSQTEDFILQACLEVDPPIWNLDAVNELLKEYRVDFQY